MSPRTWQEQTDYFESKFPPAFEAFRVQRAELLKVLEPLPADAWERTATVSAPPAWCTSTASCSTATGWRGTRPAT